jgi:ArsR family transcriptional regulator, arsenate/arsenite/antimonite-responsive transcriptional repressor
MKKEPYLQEILDLALILKALAHPARITIIKFLEKRETCICNEIVQELPLAQATVSQHLKALKQAGLVQGNITPPSVKYCLNRQKWQQAKEMIQNNL